MNKEKQEIWLPPTTREATRDGSVCAPWLITWIFNLHVSRARCCLKQVFAVETHVFPTFSRNHGEHVRSRLVFLFYPETRRPPGHVRTGLAQVDATDFRAAKAGLPGIDSLDMWPFLTGSSAEFGPSCRICWTSFTICWMLNQRKVSIIYP